MVQSTSHKHRIVLFGSGLMTPPLIDYLLAYGDTHITVASNLIKDAESLCKRSPQNMSAAFVDVFQSEQVEALMKNKTLVISFIPPWLHPHVLDPALKMNMNVVTSSYVSPYMEKLDA